MTHFEAPPTESGFRAPRAIFWTAFLVRVAYITLVHTYRITPFNHHFEFGWETGRVAASVAGGHGYSSPFSGDTGPTAWMVPGFTLILAGVFKVFGRPRTGQVQERHRREGPARAWLGASLGRGRHRRDRPEPGAAGADPEVGQTETWCCPSEPRASASGPLLRNSTCCSGHSSKSCRCKYLRGFADVDKLSAIRGQ